MIDTTDSRLEDSASVRAAAASLRGKRAAIRAVSTPSRTSPKTCVRSVRTPIPKQLAQPQEDQQRWLGAVDLGGDAVADEGPGAVEQSVGAVHAGAAEVVEHGIHAVGGQHTDTGAQTGIVVVDGFHPQRA
jgi:hypothetical protein